MSVANKIQLVPDRVERAKSFLLYQFQDKTKINLIVEALVEELQEAENTLIDLQALRTLENATGVLLDNIGDKLKVSRSNLDDNDYKTAIKVRILRKANKGTYSDILNVFRLLTRDDNPLVHVTHPYVVELTAVLACIAQTSSGIDEVLALFPVNTGVRILGKPNRPFGFAGNPDAFPFSSIQFDTPQGQMTSLIRADFGIYEDNRFQTVETYEPIALVPPTPTILPFISYTTLGVGEVLTVNVGTWAGDTPITFSYQWLRDDIAIEGETGVTYTFDSGDQGSEIYCSVVASNTAGNYVISTPSILYTTPTPVGITSNLGLNSTYTRNKSTPAPTLSSATLGISFETDGTVKVSDDTGVIQSSQYLEVVAVDAGDTYEVYASYTQGDILTTPQQTGIWQPLTTARYFELNIDNETDAGVKFSNCLYRFTVRDINTLATRDVEVQLILSNELY